MLMVEVTDYGRSYTTFKTMVDLMELDASLWLKDHVPENGDVVKVIGKRQHPTYVSECIIYACEYVTGPNTGKYFFIGQNGVEKTDKHFIKMECTISPPENSEKELSPIQKDLGSVRKMFKLPRY